MLSLLAMLGFLGAAFFLLMSGMFFIRLFAAKSREEFMFSLRSAFRFWAYALAIIAVGVGGVFLFGETQFRS